MRWVFGHYVRMDSFLLALADITIIFLVMLIAVGSPLVPSADLLVLKDEVYLVWLPTCFLGLVLFSLGVYEPSAQQTPSLLVQRLLVSGVLGGVGIVAIYQHILHQGPAITLAAVSIGVSFLLIGALRLAIRKGYLPTMLKPQVLILGVGNRAGELWDLVQNSREMVVRGFVHCEPYEVKIAEQMPADLLVPRLNSLCDYANQNGISRIVMALDERRAALPMGDLLSCRLQGVEVMDSATFFEREARKVDVANLYPSWLIFSDGFKRDVLTLSLKRLFDIVVSLTFLLFVLPLGLFTMIAIRLESAGPVFYRQKRVGLNGRPFQILKFRSMTVDAEQDGKPRWAQVDDHRITKVGAFIRKTHIDEIPQAINVLLGDMSFVGPRPERPDFVTQLSEEIRYYQERHNVKPGITGWAQVNYPYGASVDDAREKLTYDLYYMKNYNVVLDLIIMLKTTQAIFFTQGAR